MAQSQVTSELTIAGEDAIVLALPSAANYDKVLVSLLGSMSKQHLSIIYITLNKPALTIAKMLQKEKIPIQNIHFVDCVTSLVQPDARGNGRVMYVNPNNLTGISIAVNEFMENLPKPTAVVFDSLATLLVYNTLSEVQRFSIYLNNRIRLAGSRGFLLTVDSEMNPELLQALGKVCDKIIRP